MKGISIVVCCKNSTLRLPETIRHICNQRIGEKIKAEVIVIDNGSSDGTLPMAERLLQDFGCPVPYRLLQETTPGVVHARLRGMKEAAYEYLLFCDDDNWLDKDYARRAFTMLEKYPQIGAIGGIGVASCEINAPSWFAAFPGIYAVGSRAKKSGKVEKKAAAFWTAGLALRMEPVNTILNSGYKFMLTGRKGKASGAGEDSELCYMIRLLGYELWYDEKMVYHHFIPSQRLQWKYVRKVGAGFGKSWPLLKVFVAYLDEKKFDLSHWRKMLLQELLFLFDPRTVWSYLKAIKRKDNWIAVAYPARWKGLWDLISLRNRIPEIQANMDKVLVQKAVIGNKNSMVVDHSHA